MYHMYDTYVRGYVCLKGDHVVAHVAHHEPLSA